jgi:large subunit ribosomal protein L3
MTRIFDETGVSTPVTVIEVEPNHVTQVKTDHTDGYSALQVTVGSRRPNRVTSPLKGHFAKAGAAPGRGLWEFRVDAETASQYEAGVAIPLELFEAGQKVDVSGTSIGRGFSGVMRRHGFKGGRATHGNSKAHRKAGSLARTRTQGVFLKERKWPGRWAIRPGHSRT